ncbi:MAG: hypothetical protein AAGP08_18545 [Pseudomonadota bacterium]
MIKSVSYFDAVAAAFFAMGSAVTGETISFDEFGPQPFIFDDQSPLDTQYAALGVTFSGGWEILDDLSFKPGARSGGSVAAFNTINTGITDTLTMQFSQDIASIKAYVGAFDPGIWTVSGFLNGKLEQQAEFGSPAETRVQIGLEGRFDRVTVLGETLGPLTTVEGSLDDLSFKFSPIPLPPAVGLLGAGLTSMVILRRQRRQSI